jgi:cell division FtsZ-interacting protein ZapD
MESVGASMVKVVPGGCCGCAMVACYIVLKQKVKKKNGRVRRFALKKLNGQKENKATMTTTMTLETLGSTP